MVRMARVGGIVKIGDLVRVNVDIDYHFDAPSISFVAIITNTKPYLLDVYCPEDQKNYEVPRDWCEVI